MSESKLHATDAVAAALEALPCYREWAGYDYSSAVCDCPRCAAIRELKHDGQKWEGRVCGPEENHTIPEPAPASEMPVDEPFNAAYDAASVCGTCNDTGEVTGGGCPGVEPDDCPDCRKDVCGTCGGTGRKQVERPLSGHYEVVCPDCRKDGE